MIWARAIARAEVLTLGITVGSVGIGVGAFTVGPSLISASQDTITPGDTPSDPALMLSCETMRTLFTSAREVLGVWDQEETGFNEVLLWYRDIHDPDRINRDEVMLITHNRSLGVLVSYTCSGATGTDLAAELGLEVEGEASDPASSAPCDGALPRSAFSQRFPWSWRSDNAAQRAVVATGLSSFTMERVREPGDLPGWRVRLTWGTENADTESEACAFVVNDER